MTQRWSDDDLRMFTWFMNGRCQAEIVAGLKIDKSKVSRTLERFLKAEVLEEDCKIRPKTYKKGKNGVILEAELSRRGFSTNSHENAPSVAQFSHESNDKSLTGIPKVHHICYRALVEHEGDLPLLISPEGSRRDFLKKGKPIRGQDQYNGEIECKDGKTVGVMYQRPFDTGRTAWVYFYIPEFLMLADDIDAGQWKAVALAYASEAAECMVSWGKWVLGPLARLSAWKPHFGVPLPEMEGYSDRMTMSSRSGAVCLSNSGGQAEIEVHGEDNTHLVRSLVEIPEALYGAEVRLTETEVLILRVAETVRDALKVDSDLTSLAVRNQARLAEQQLEQMRKSVEANTDDGTTNGPTTSPPEQSDRWDGMYR